MTPPTAPLPAGASLQNGKYVIERTLGQGGFGITYRARSGLHPVVAVKELFLNSGAVYCVREAATRTVSPQFDAGRFAQFKQQFLDEARLLATFRQVPGVVDVLDFFEENGTAYFVMDFISETTLADLTPIPLPEAGALRYVRQVGAALEAVHQSGILHRDLKPSNVLIDASDRAVLIDFGIARSYVQDQTAVHTTFHSPGYAAPEQVVQSATRGAFTDVYALAGTLYFCLTGQRPPSLEERSVDGFRSVRKLNSAVSREVDAAVTKALELKAKDRFQTVGAFLRALEEEVTVAFPGPQPLPKPPDPGSPTPVGPIVEERKSSKWNVLIPALVISVLALAGLGYWFSKNDISKVTPNPADSLLLAHSDSAAVWYFDEVERTHTQHRYQAALTALQTVAASTDSGRALAQNLLGELYTQGHGVEKSAAEATKWYRQSAENGNALGQYNLGYQHYFGVGTPTNKPEGLTYLKRSAQQSLQTAQDLLRQVGGKP